MLTEKKKDYFKRLLNRQQEQLLKGNFKPIAISKEEQEGLFDFTDQASVESERDLNYRINERERRLMAKIQEALNRLDSDTFGICEECGEDISEKRLKARPVTTLCISCKKEQEAMERARGI